MSHTLIRSTTAALAAAALAVGATSVPAVARTIPGISGRAPNAADAGCFAESYGAQINTCGTMRNFAVPFTIDTAGTMTVNVRAYGPTPNNNVGCLAWGNSLDGLSHWGSPMIFLSQFDTPQELWMTTYVPGGGYLFAWCDVYPQGKVISAWNQ